MNFHSVLARRFECTLWRLAVGQQLAHGNDGEHTDEETEQARNSSGQHIHRSTGLIGIETGDDQVWRRTNQRTHTTHARCIAQRNQQFRRRDAQFLRPHLDDAYEEGHNSGVAEERTKGSHWEHESDDSLGIALRLTQQVFHNPLQHTGMGKSCHHYEEHSNDDY